MMNPAPDSDPHFSALDSYVAELHSGRSPDRSEVLKAHPQLADALDCLDALDQLAPPSELMSGAAGIEKTLTWSDQTAPPALSASATVPGDFGEYELLAEIGRGGMGVVYKARQKGLDRVVAIKMILASRLASPEDAQRFHAEARAAARLNHPHILNVYEAGQIHGQHYFAMQYVSGSSLAELARKGPLDSDRAAQLVALVARAVDHLHAHGIVHRDLKPSNILLDDRGQPYVSDFGLVKMLAADSHITRTGDIVGTPSYMAPEQASGRVSQVGPWSDVYSLGAILYELLTARVPFRGETPLDTLVQVLESEPSRPTQLNPRIPRELEMICLRCLEKAPEERYPSAAALADDLDRFLKGDEVEAKNPGPWQQLRRWVRREPALVSRLIAIAICAIIIQINYHIGDTLRAEVHRPIMGILAGWALASFLFQRLMSRDQYARLARFGWAATDAVALTAMLWIDNALISPLVIVFPALVAASGLWFQKRLVWFTTLISELGYGALVWDSYSRGTPFARPHHHLLFMVVLAVLGFMVAYQVHRVKVLSRYYEHRRLP